MSPAIRTKSAPPQAGDTCNLSDAPVGAAVTVVGIDTLTATVGRRGPGAVDVRLTSAPRVVEINGRQIEFAGSRVVQWSTRTQVRLQ